MPNRDYAARSKAKKGGNKLLILTIIILLLLLSGLGLWILQDKMSSQPAPKPAQSKTSQKNELPSKPEEIYSYIRDLETREVPVSNDSKLARLTKEQEQQILKKQEQEKQQLAQQVATNTTENQPVETTETPLTEEQLAAQKAEELKKQQELAKKAEQERKAKEAAKNQTKIVATAKPASEAPKAVGKYGLQCGAFKSKAQAENMQARLAMAGYNARVVSSAEWNRVFVGPVGDRAAASAAQSNARSVAECLIVGM